MATNSVGDFIRSVFPTIVSKSGKTFRALLADGDGGGTIEKVFSDLEETRKAWTDIKSIYDMRGEMFKKTMSVFSVLTMLPTDTEETYRNRLRLLFHRNGHTLWGTAFDILDIFKTLTDNKNIYLVNNTDDKNLLENGNFERNTGWALQDCSYEREARFEETTGILFNASGFLSQNDSVSVGATYFLHFFVKGNIRLKITDNNGRFWNPFGGDVGSWTTVEHYVSFASEDWKDKSLFFVTDSKISRITVTFAYESGKYAFLDYVRLNEKTGASTFSLLAVFEGKYNNKTAHFAPGEADPIVAPADYKKYGYYAAGDADGIKTAAKANSFIEQAPIQEDKSPILQAGNNDIEPLEGYENMSYNDETKAFAADSPTGSDDYQSVDYSKASYFDDTFIFGASGKQMQEIYQELLDIVQPAGIIGTVEVLTRESDD